MKRLVIALMVIGLFIFEGESQGQPQQMDKPNWRVGDTWLYKITSRVEGGLFSKAQVNSVIQRRVVKEETDKYYVISAAKGKLIFFHNKENLNLVRVENEKGEIIDDYQPERPLFKWPLKVGEKWSYRFSHSPAGPDDPPYVDGEIKVVGTETLVIQDKEISTFKLIEHRYNPRGALVMEATYWVSPEVGNLVKWIDKRELTGKYFEGEIVDYIPSRQAK